LLNWAIASRSGSLYQPIEQYDGVPPDKFADLAKYDGS